MDYDFCAERKALKARVATLTLEKRLFAQDAKAAHLLIADLKRDRDEALQGLETVSKEVNFLRTDRDYFHSRQEAALRELDHAAGELIYKDDEIQRLRAVGKKESERILYWQREVSRLKTVVAGLGYHIGSLKASRDWHKKTREEALTYSAQVKGELKLLRERIAALTAPAPEEGKSYFTAPALKFINT